MRLRRHLLFSIMLAISNAGSGYTVNSLQAVRIVDEKIHIDGKLEELIWQTIPADCSFTQFEPDPGKSATFPTEIRIAFDDHALYVGMHACEKDPGQITYQLARRDSEIPADFMAFMVDSYDDHRTAFTFAVYATGVKYDSYFNNDVNNDVNWDAVWEVRTSTRDDGWYAEFRIPFSQLRFPDKEVHSWGFQALRFRNVNHELDHWQFIPEDAPGWVSQFGRLEGISHIPQPRKMQILPYVVSIGEYFPKEEGNQFQQKPHYDVRAGADLKYGLTSNMTLDFTLNPDFGQVEADPSEVNLSAYETYFAEKRPFFLEGNSIFDYRIGVGDGPLGSETLFYSRRIGRRPQHEPDLPDEDFYQMPQWTKIIAAAKISGKTARGWSVGVLEALTDEMKSDIQHGTDRYSEIAEPRANYLLARVQKDYRAGRTIIGALATNVFRDINTPEIYQLSRSASTFGLDFSHKWHNDHFMIDAKLYGSDLRGRKEAIQEAQESSVRYFQRPDASHLKYDPDRTWLGGYGATFMVYKIAGGHWRYGTGALIRSPGFELNDLGYLRQADFNLGFIYWNYEQFEPGKIFRRYHIGSDIFTARDFGGNHLFSGINLGLNFQFLNYWGFWLGAERYTQELSPYLLRGGPSMLTPPATAFRAGISSDERKRISFQFQVFALKNDEGFGEFSVSPNLILRPTGQLYIYLMLNYERETNDLQYVDEIEDQNEKSEWTTHYVVGRIRTQNIYLTTRFNYTFTPDITLQFYGMPFIFSGDYSNFREPWVPRQADYHHRLKPYDYPWNEDFNFKEFRSNLVFRWEYHPGSTLFVVWAHSRTHETEEDGSFRPGRDIHRLFHGETENVWLIKLNKWFNF